MAIHFKQKNILDFCNLLLAISFMFFVLRFSALITLPHFESRDQVLDYSNAPTSEKVAPTPIVWGRNRNFPPSFTVAEKILLTEQKHDYERTTPDLEAQYQKYLKIRDSLPVRSSTITVIKYQNDCFVRPTILKARPGQKLLIQNPNDTSANLGMAGETWNIPAHGNLLVTLKLKETQANQIYWGYSCSEFGLAGYFVIDN